MMVEWEDGEGRTVTSVGFEVSAPEEVNGTTLLAGAMDPVNRAEWVAGNVQEIPNTNIIKKWRIARPTAKN
jgi:hypothetical protein